MKKIKINSQTQILDNLLYCYYYSCIYLESGINEYFLFIFYTCHFFSFD